MKKLFKNPERKNLSYDPGEGDLWFKDCRYCNSEWCEECELYNQNHCRQTNIVNSRSNDSMDLLKGFSG